MSLILLREYNSRPQKCYYYIINVAQTHTNSDWVNGLDVKSVST